MFQIFGDTSTFAPFGNVLVSNIYSLKRKTCNLQRFILRASLIKTGELWKMGIPKIILHYGDCTQGSCLDTEVSRRGFVPDDSSTLAAPMGGTQTHFCLSSPCLLLLISETIDICKFLIKYIFVSICSICLGRL